MLFRNLKTADLPPMLERPELDLAIPTRLETATLALG